MDNPARPDDGTTDAEGRASAAPRQVKAAGTALLAFCLVLIAFNLRPVFSSLSVVLPEVRQDTGLGAVSISVLTTLPVLCLGLLAPFAPKLAERFGPERVLLGVLLLVGIGTALRGIDTVVTLYLGTAIAGLAIAVGNVLLPGMVKRDFPGRIAMVTGFYAMALCGGAAVAAAFTQPLQRALGGYWHLALAIWAVPAFAAALIWATQLPPRSTVAARTHRQVIGLWRDPLAWQVTLFMGLQSALAYCVLGWLAPIIRLRGVDAVTAGFMVSFSVMMQVAASLFVPSLGARSSDQRLINVALALLTTIGLLGFMFAPLWSLWIWAPIQGIGQGGLFAIAMTMIALRSPDASVASHLSGMAQGVGYVLAATGPLLLGLFLDGSHDFRAPALMFVVLGLALCLFGLGAGRSLHVRTRSER
ncbi:MAG: MFS transporter [Beijerinckiaceae bacterium]|nr:MFS transporter [Beijerinckiaceae bacterium]